MRLARFAPDLRVLIHHGAERLGGPTPTRFRGGDRAARPRHHHLRLLPRDEATLAKVAVGRDRARRGAEHQERRRASRAASCAGCTRQLRIALTGTPVENRLGELWSIMDFLNPGYLGAHERFRRASPRRIEQRRDEAAPAQLRRSLGPFILRRLKTDPAIIRDLPEKIEMREYLPADPRAGHALRGGRARVAAPDRGEQRAMRRRGVVLAHADAGSSRSAITRRTCSATAARCRAAPAS